MQNVERGKIYNLCVQSFFIYSFSPVRVISANKPASRVSHWLDTLLMACKNMCWSV